MLQPCAWGSLWRHFAVWPVPCRPATSDSIDQHMPQIGIPGFVQSGSTESTQIYFAFIKRRPKQVHALEEGPFGADR